MNAESLLRYWGEWVALEVFRRQRADLQRRPVIEWLVEAYDGAWNPRYSLLIDRSVVAEEACAS